MVRIAIDDTQSVVQIRAQWSYTGYGGGESSWSFILPRAGGDGRGLVLAAWESACMPYFVAARPISWRLDRVLAEDRWPQEFGTLVDDVRLAADPPGTGHGLPPQVSPLISWRTGDTGRANRGRTFMGPYTVDSCEESNVVGDGDAAVSDFAEAMMSTFAGTVFAGDPLFAIVSRREDVEHGRATAYSPVTNYYYFGRWAVVHRRLQFDWRT